EGKPDLSGLWEAAPKYDSDFAPSIALPWAQAQAQARAAEPASDPWAHVCAPTRHEGQTTLRQIFMDGRDLPKDANPTWQGYSVGRWDGDTLVVESIGFNDKTMVGRPAPPNSEALRITESYTRH